MADEKVAPGDSSVQRNVEPELLALLAQKLGINLTASKLKTPNGSWLEVFGVSQDPPVLTEVCAHQGQLKSGQKQKLMANAFKLLYAERLLAVQARKIMVLADADAAEAFRKRSWIAAAFEALNIEVLVLPLPQEVRESIRQAQGRQFR
jgi:hypothetical protein